MHFCPPPIKYQQPKHHTFISADDIQPLSLQFTEVKPAKCIYLVLLNLSTYLWMHSVANVKLSDDTHQVSLINWMDSVTESLCVCMQQCNIHNLWPSTHYYINRERDMHLFICTIHIDHKLVYIKIYNIYLCCIAFNVLAIRWLPTLFTVCHLAINQLP